MFRSRNNEGNFLSRTIKKWEFLELEWDFSLKALNISEFSQVDMRKIQNISILEREKGIFRFGRASKSLGLCLWS